MKATCKAPRRGVAVVWLLIVLGLLTAIMANIARQHWHNRWAIQQRQQQLQADWLARGGWELAAARLLADPAGYTGEKATPIPGGLVRISVKAETGKSPSYRVTAEAQYRTDDAWPVNRSFSGRFRRVVENAQVRIERVDDDNSLR